MRRRTVDIIVGVGGLGVAVVLLVLGLVMTSNADFSERYVGAQLKEQRITFKPANALTEHERERPCLVENAGQPLVAGKQAECYANDLIGLHLAQAAKGRSFSEISLAQMAMRARVAEAQKVSDPALPDLQKQLGELSALKATVFEGNMNRGALLTSYGFSTLGEKGAQAATVSYWASGLLALLGLGFVVHAVRTPRTRTFASPVPATKQGDAIPAV